ncbi:MAG: large conductance mechanosensitive channel protein [Gammaproteobacteria bacterium]|jgi:large conductance mechanosensitive channel protein
MAIVQEFKDFALRGNVLDMAVGIIIGAAFGTIVKSLVADVIMAPIGMMTDNVDFTDLFYTLQEGAKAPGPYVSLAAAKAAGAVTINYGAFINTVISFPYRCLRRVHGNSRAEPDAEGEGSRIGNTGRAKCRRKSPYRNKRPSQSSRIN